MKEVIWGFIHGEGTIECSCDACCNTYDYEFDNGYPDFKDCQEEIKEYGWFSKYINGDWYDFCSEECYRKWLSKNR